MNTDFENEFDEYIPHHNQHGRNDRFKYAKVRRGDDWFFLKIATTPQAQRGLQREAIWPIFMDEVAQQFPDEHIRTPKFVEFIGDTAALFEYVDAPIMMTGNNAEPWRASINRYARMLYVLDQAAEGWTSDLLPGDLNRTEEYEADWRRWLGDNVHKIDHGRFDGALQMVADYSNRITTRMQHGDLTPWQIFDDGGEWVIYDGERCGTDLPRYHDLAYGYGRLFTKLRAPEVAAQLLHSFLDQSKVSLGEFHNQFALVMMGRAMGMLADAYTDKNTDDYLDEARALFDLCLEGNLERLLSPL